MIPLWAVTTLWFLRSFETRSLGCAALAGAGGAGRDARQILVGLAARGLGIAALADPRRGAYFRSAAPWVTIAVGALVLAPHVAWLVANDFVAFTYALATPQRDAFGGRAAVGSASSLARCLCGGAARAGAIAVRPSARRSPTRCGRATPERRLVALAFCAPLVLPLLSRSPRAGDRLAVDDVGA